MSLQFAQKLGSVVPPGSPNTIEQLTRDVSAWREDVVAFACEANLKLSSSLLSSNAFLPHLNFNSGGGSADRLSPPECLRAQFALAHSEDKTLHIFGKDRGDPFDYGHGDLIFGQGAPTEVYPALRAWLEARATPRE